MKAYRFQGGLHIEPDDKDDEKALERLAQVIKIEELRIKDKSEREASAKIDALTESQPEASELATEPEIVDWRNVVVNFGTTNRGVRMGLLGKSARRKYAILNEIGTDGKFDPERRKVKRAAIISLQSENEDVPSIEAQQEKTDCERLRQKLAENDITEKQLLDLLVSEKIIPKELKATFINQIPISKIRGMLTDQNAFDWVIRKLNPSPEEQEKNVSSEQS